MRKISTVVTDRIKIFKDDKLTIGLDLGDRSSHYCILDEAGNVILEHNVPTTPKGIHQMLGTETSRAGRKECQEASRHCRSTEVGRTAAEALGERGS